MSPRPLLVVTSGDPVGIGPEIIARAATDPDLRRRADLLVLGDAYVLRAGADAAGVALEVVPVDTPLQSRLQNSPGVLSVLPLSEIEPDTHVWGAPTPATDTAQLRYVEEGIALVREAPGRALVTAPISKAAIQRAGAPWPGHTEMLAALAGEGRAPVMMLAGPRLRAIPLTTHVSLRDVPGRITQDGILYAIEVVTDALRRWFGVEDPRVAVAGLNPHAGEGGLFGGEEAETIRPAIEVAMQRGYTVSGPESADTVFGRAVSGQFDAVIAMYHDQALIPVKVLDFDRSVNVTLGLPIIRTSVDHGTAYDIAGQGVASATSLLAAMNMAADMVWRSSR